MWCDGTIGLDWTDWKEVFKMDALRLALERWAMVCLGETTSCFASVRVVYLEGVV